LVHLTFEPVLEEVEVELTLQTRLDLIFLLLALLLEQLLLPNLREAEARGLRESP